MKVDEAKIWATIPREKIAVIAPNLDKYFDELVAYANGEEIEMRDRGKWIKVSDPYFLLSEEYRVKPRKNRSMITNNHFISSWKPERNEKYYYIGIKGEILGPNWWDGSYFENYILSVGNCFRTYKEAEEYKELIMPEAKKPVEQWIPKEGELFFSVLSTGMLCQGRLGDGVVTTTERLHVKFGNCFKTISEAEAAKDRVQAALRGEIATKKEVVESLDGEPLGDYEKELLRIFRKAKLHEYCMIENVVKFESIKGCGIELLIPYDNGRKEFFDAIKKFTKEKEK